MSLHSNMQFTPPARVSKKLRIYPLVHDKKYNRESGNYEVIWDKSCYVETPELAPQSDFFDTHEDIASPKYTFHKMLAYLQFALMENAVIWNKFIRFTEHLTEQYDEEIYLPYLKQTRLDHLQALLNDDAYALAWAQIKYEMLHTMIDHPRLNRMSWSDLWQQKFTSLMYENHDKAFKTHFKHSDYQFYRYKFLSRASFAPDMVVMLNINTKNDLGNKIFALIAYVWARVWQVFPDKFYTEHTIEQQLQICLTVLRFFQTKFFVPQKKNFLKNIFHHFKHTLYGVTEITASRDVQLINERIQGISSIYGIYSFQFPFVCCKNNASKSSSTRKIYPSKTYQPLWQTYFDLNATHQIVFEESKKNDNNWLKKLVRQTHQKLAEQQYKFEEKVEDDFKCADMADKVSITTSPEHDQLEEKVEDDLIPADVADKVSISTSPEHHQLEEKVEDDLIPADVARMPEMPFFVEQSEPESQFVADAKKHLMQVFYQNVLNVLLLSLVILYICVTVFLTKLSKTSFIYYTLFQCFIFATILHVLVSFLNFNLTKSDKIYYLLLIAAHIMVVIVYTFRQKKQKKHNK